MGSRGKLLIGALLLIALGGGIWWWVKRERPSYEAGFAEYIWIEYPPGQMLNDAAFGGARMDELLRERKLGYLGGVTSKGDPPEVVEVELAVDLDALGAHALVEEFREKGWLPEGFQFEAGTYPRAWPE